MRRNRIAASRRCPSCNRRSAFEIIVIFTGTLSTIILATGTIAVLMGY